MPRRILTAIAIILLVAAFSRTPVFCGAVTPSSGSTVVGTRALIEVDLPAYWRSSAEKVSHADRARKNEVIMDQSAEVLRRRVADMTGVLPSLLLLRNNRIQVGIPGFTDIAKLREYFAPPEKLSVRLVDDKVSDDDSQRTRTAGG
jgi:preprotein translocase subunit SecD